MIVHRFMSEAEYDCLISGAKLMNATNHADNGQLTNSVGFCFFTEDPDKAIHWLSGCTYPERCVTMEVPDTLLSESYGTYRDPKRDNLNAPPPKGGRPTIKRREYCTTHYSLAEGVRVLSSTDRYRKYADYRRALVEIGLIKP